MSDHPVDLPDLRAGVYRHWKGQPYQVLGYAHDANYENRDIVVYMGLELNQAHLGPRLAVRTVNRDVYPGHDAWEDLMCLSHGCPMDECEDGSHGQHPNPEIVRRFDYRGSQYLGGMQHEAY